MSFKIYTCTKCGTVVGMVYDIDFNKTSKPCPICEEDMCVANNYEIDEFLDSVDEFNSNRNHEDDFDDEDSQSLE